MNRTTIAALVGAAALAAPASASATSSYETTVLQDSPLVFLQMEEPAGATTALDSSPNHRDGTYVNATLGVQGPFAAAGNAVALDGTSTTSTVSATVAQTSGSVELWVNPARLRRGQQAGFVAHGDPAGDGWALGIGAKRRLTFVTSGKAQNLRTNIPSATWTDLTVTWAAGSLRIYLNGAALKKVPLTTAAPASSDGGLVIGGTGRGAFTGAFSGRVDEVALYEQALSAAQVGAHFGAAHLPLNTGLPTITGTPQVGETLSVTAGTWTGATIAPTYRWQSCDAAGEDCDDIAGATGSSYVLAAQDAGTTVQVVETVGNAAGSVSETSDTTAVIAAAPGGTTGGGTTGGDTTGGTGTGTGTDPAAGTPGTTDPAAGTTGTTDPAAGTAGTTGTTGSKSTDQVLAQVTGRACLRLAGAKRTVKLRRIGVLRLVVARDGCIGKGAPLSLRIKAAKGKRLAAVRYRLDGKAVRVTGKTRRAALTAARLRAGRHVLTVRVTPRGGKARTFKVRVRTVRR